MSDDDVEAAAPTPLDYLHTAATLSCVALSCSGLCLYVAVRLGFGPIFLMLFVMAAMFMGLSLYSYHRYRKML